MADIVQKEHLPGDSTIADKLFSLLSEEIIQGIREPGEKINELELAERFGISRSPIREAIRRLEERNLVVRKSWAGVRVVSISLAEGLMIYDVREALESKACELAASNITESELSRLRELLAEHEQRSETPPQPEDGSTIGLEFHSIITKASRNDHLISLLCDNYFYQMSIMKEFIKLPYRRNKQSFMEHLLIISALRDRDPQMAFLAMRQHIKSSRKLYKELNEIRPSSGVPDEPA